MGEAQASDSTTKPMRLNPAADVCITTSVSLPASPAVRLSWASAGGPDDVLVDVMVRRVSRYTHPIWIAPRITAGRMLSRCAWHHVCGSQRTLPARPHYEAGNVFLARKGNVEGEVPVRRGDWAYNCQPCMPIEEIIADNKRRTVAPSARARIEDRN